MKVAIFKIGARIHQNEKIGNSTNEILSCVEMLLEAGVNVTGITKVLDSDNKDTTFPIKDFKWFFENINSFDKVIVVNGTYNFFGGAENECDIMTYKAINKFDKEIVYMLYDPYLTPKQMAKNVESKEWGSKYNIDELVIPENRLHYITQCRDTSSFKPECKKTIQYYPLELFPMFTEHGYFTEVDFDKAEFDLNYAGTWRGGRREKSMIKYFFGLPDDIRVQMFGNLKLEQFKKHGDLRPPQFGAPVTHDKVRENILRGLSTVIIGDPLYAKLDDIAQRAAESIIFGQITFIDSDYDRKNRFYKDKELKDFLRIDNREQLVDRLRFIKKDKTMFYNLLKAQRDDLFKDFDPHQYCVGLAKMIEMIHD